MDNRLDSSGELCDLDFVLLCDVHKSKIASDNVRDIISAESLFRFLDLLKLGYLNDSGDTVVLTDKGLRAFKQWKHVEKWKDRKSFKTGFITGLLSGIALTSITWIISKIPRLLIQLLQ